MTSITCHKPTLEGGFSEMVGTERGGRAENPSFSGFAVALDRESLCWPSALVPNCSGNTGTPLEVLNWFSTLSHPGPSLVEN